MLYEFCYYLALTGSVCVTAAGATYYYNKKVFYKIASAIGTNGLYLYHDIITFLKTYDNQGKSNDISKDLEETDDDDLLSYSSDNGETAMTKYAPDNADIIFMKRKIEDKTYCKRINKNDDIKNLKFEPANIPFIQVELKQNDKTLEIQEHLNYFYIVDNVILDSVFLKWYMEYWFAIPLAEEYKVHIIDNNVNIFTISPAQSILITKDGYVPFPLDPLDVEEDGEAEAEEDNDSTK